MRSPKDPNLMYGVLNRLAKYDIKEQKLLKAASLDHSYYCIALNKAGSKVYLGGTYKKGGRLQRFSANLDDAGRIRLGHAYLVHQRLYQRILDEAEGCGLPIDWYYSEKLHPQVRSLLVRPVLAALLAAGAVLGAAAAAWLVLR